MTELFTETGDLTTQVVIWDGMRDVHFVSAAGEQNI
jgi:hypothetical protein